jgi:hypothetical protein
MRQPGGNEHCDREGASDHWICPPQGARQNTVAHDLASL